jgi:hypothetical protein
MTTGICGVGFDPAIDRYLAARDIQVCRGPSGNELGAVKTKSLVDLAWSVVKSVAVPGRECVSTLNIVGRPISGPPAYHVCRWRRARLTLSCATGVEDVEYFGCSQDSIEGLDLVDAAVEGSGASTPYPNGGWD